MQVVGYRTIDARLLVATDGTVEELALEPGTELTYALGDRHCAGQLDWSGMDEIDGGGVDADDGDAEEPDRGPTHVACDRPVAPFCPEHTVPWSAVSKADSDEEHAVYLAGFTPATYKVGVTRSWRLETRLREQGADRAAHVRTMPDGRTARDLEADIARDVGDQVRVAQKIRGLGRDFDDDRWERLLDDYDVIETYAFEYGLDLGSRDAAPVPETMLTGTVRGTKGRVMVLDRGGTPYAVDVQNLVGYELTEGGDDGDRQASLGTF